MPLSVTAKGRSTVMRQELGQKESAPNLLSDPLGGIGAATVERHNELARQAFHRIDAQLTSEGIVFTPEDVVAEALMAKNCLLNVHGQSPYRAVTGRVPRLLRDFDNPGATEAGEVDDNGNPLNPSESSPNVCVKLLCNQSWKGQARIALIAP